RRYLDEIDTEILGDRHPFPLGPAKIRIEQQLGSVRLLHRLVHWVSSQSTRKLLHASRRRGHPFGDRQHDHQSLIRRSFAISPMTPRRNSSTHSTKITPWITVTHWPS